MSVAYSTKLDTNYRRLRELLDAGLLIEDENIIQLIEDLQVVGTSTGVSILFKLYLL